MFRGRRRSQRIAMPSGRFFPTASCPDPSVWNATESAKTSLQFLAVKGKSLQLHLFYRDCCMLARRTPVRRLLATLYYGSKSVMSQDTRPVYLRLRDII